MAVPIGVGGALSTPPVTTTLELLQWYYMSIADGMELKLLSIELYVLLAGATVTTCFLSNP
jgi:hypothetical protein